MDTHYICLANREQIVAPSAALKARLQQAGLGHRKICFNWKATAAEVKTKLEEVYPKLENGGGFEIMRCGGAQVNDLMVIQPPCSGYSVPFLRDTAGLGQAIAFIQPVQIDLDMQPEQVMDIFEVHSEHLTIFIKHFAIVYIRNFMKFFIPTFKICYC